MASATSPRLSAPISLASREKLDNLIWVVNCNLQRLDGPVRGNGKIIQELESGFRGAGWNVIKVVWGSGWDPLLDADHEGALVQVMNDTVDGEYQRYKVENGAFVRDNFFAKDPRALALVEGWSDDEIWALRRGGLDYRKVYAAYKLATELTGAPTVILAKTIKGWTLGPDVEGRNATHQIKELTNAQLRELRTRLSLQEDVSEDSLEGDKQPQYLRFADDSPEAQYLHERRKVLNGYLPSRLTEVRSALTLPGPGAFSEIYSGSGKVEASTTTAFTRLAPQPGPDRGIRAPGGPDRPRRSPHFWDGFALPRAQDLRQLGPALRAGRCQALAQLRRVPGGPNP